MTTNDKRPTRNYDSDKEKSEIDSDIRVLKIKQRLAARIPVEEIAFYLKVKLSVSIDSLLSWIINFHSVAAILTKVLANQRTGNTPRDH